MSETTPTQTVQQPDIPFATVKGEAITHLPEDLYIPPDALEVILEAFTGPLDLLLYLIRRQNLDILDIPIAEITQQYVKYIEMMQDMRLELAAEYLVMAAILAEVKSRMLLPKPAQEGEEEVDPRAELIRRLQEYERFKQAAEDIDALPREDRDIFIAHAEAGDLHPQQSEPTMELQELILALRDVLVRADLFTEHRIESEPLSVRERMSIVLKSLNTKHPIEFEKLFTQAEGRHGVVVTFIAMLELLKEHLIDIIQKTPGAQIYLRAANQSNEPTAV